MNTVYNISDSTDWLDSSLPSLAPLESALRCQICKDFFSNPVITSCSHTFCSLCIRRCLSSEGKCPACRTTDQLLKLRRNWAVQEILESFQNARPSVLALARQTMTTTTTTADVNMEESRKMNAEEVDDNSELSHPAAKKRRLNQSDNPATVEMRRTRSQANQSAQQPALTVPDFIDDAKDEDFVPDDGLVPCPMCNRRMKEGAVFNHLDHCKGSGEEGPSTSQTFNLRTPQHMLQFPQAKSPATGPTKPLERLPTMNYSLIKDGQLRKKLKELGIPEWGPRSLLQRRHTEWMNLWNANCDAKVPKTKEELLRDLDVWERTQGGAGLQSGLLTGSNAVMAKTFDAAAWSSNHDDDFKRLIENARKKKDAKKPNPVESQDSTAENQQRNENMTLNNDSQEGASDERLMDRENVKESLYQPPTLISTSTPTQIAEGDNATSLHES